MKQVNDKIHEIQKHPAAGGNALDMMRRLPGLVHCLYDAIRKPSHMCIRRAGGDYEKIGGVTEPSQVENLYSRSLAIFDGTDGGANGRRQARRAAFSQLDPSRPAAPGCR